MRLLKDNLFVQFSVISFVLLTVTVVVVIAVLSSTIRSHAIDALADQAKADVSSRLLGEITPADLEVPMTGERYNRFHQFVQESIVSERTARVKLWAKDGTVIYSNDPAGVGEKFPDNETLLKALRGETATEIRIPEGPEHEHDRFLNTLMEVYTPIVFPGATEVQGAFEIYQYYEPTARLISDLTRDILMSAGLAFVVFYGALVSVIWRGWRTITRQREKRKQTEEKLLQAAQEWRTTFDSISDLVSIHDKDNKIIRVNKAFASAFKMNPKEVIGKTCYELFHGIKEPLPNCPYAKTLKTKKPVITEFFEPRLDIHLEVTTSPIFDEQGEVTASVHIARDITKRRQAEEDKEKMQSQLLQSQKMDAVGMLAGGIAHDFNNLLTAIIGYSDLALIKLTDDDPLQDDVKEIKNAGERAASLTRQLLAFSHKQTLQPQVLDLNSVVTNINKMLRRLIGEDIEIVTVLAPGLKQVSADPGQIEQVIMNLAINARDAMPEGGRLTIKTENITLDEDATKIIPEARPGEFVRLSVEDTGVGMDKENIQHIFEPFFTTKKPGKGTGLGLSVVYGIIKQHQGWMNVYSEPEQGSTFKLYLPAVSAGQAESKEKVVLTELKGTDERILLVEDESGVRQFAATVLGDNGYIVFEATSAEVALNIFNREKGDFHLIFSDVVLTDKSGLHLVDQLLSQKPEVPVLMSSGYADQKSQWQVIQQRGFRFLQKPYTIVTLLQAVRDAIEQAKTG